MLVKRRPARPAKREHPTKTTLIATVVTMLDTIPVEEITCDAVLDTSGISRGSLYYHFADFGDLVEHALVARFSRYVDESIQALSAAVANAKSKAEFRTNIGKVIKKTHARDRAEQRFERAIPFAAAANSERFRTTLGAEQQRLTDAQTDTIRAAQQAGWITASLNAQAVAVFLQAYSLGRIVDDVTPSPMESKAWDDLVMSILDRVLVTT
jgi:AcrR family transcriptional regulator